VIVRRLKSGCLFAPLEPTLQDYERKVRISIWGARLSFPVARNVTGDDIFLYPTELLVRPFALLYEVTYNLL
jgi:hypothetical protein